MNRIGMSLIFAGCVLLSSGASAQSLIGSTGGAGGGSTSPGAIVSIDPSDGTGTVLGTPYGGDGIPGIAEAPDGTVYAVSSTQSDGAAHLLEIDPATGALITDLGQILDSSGNPCAINDLDFHPGTGVLYGVAANNVGFGLNCGLGISPGGYLLTIDTTTLEYTLVGRDPSLGNNSGGIAFDASGTLYFTPGWNTVGTIHTLDLTDGSFTSTVALSQAFGFHGLEVDPNTGTMYASLPMTSSCCSPANTNIYTIDPVSGTVTAIGSPGDYSVHDMVFVQGGVAAEARATFEVNKVFTDGNPNGVEVTISCNTGLPLEQSQVITEAEGVEFVVVEYDDGELDCEITEDVPDGYGATYFDGTANSSTSCEFVGVTHGAENSCRITNEPEPVDIDVEKDWVFEGTTDGEGIDLRYEVTFWCSSEIVNGTQIGVEEVESPAGLLGCGQIVSTLESPQLIPLTWCKTFYGEGPLDATHTAQVIPDYPSSLCLVSENVYDSAIETSNGCFFVSVSAGEGASCTITNTVFFEGIPTLNQYGLALLALLMLGVGMVGFRRFA